MGIRLGKQHPRCLRDLRHSSEASTDPATATGTAAAIAASTVRAPPALTTASGRASSVASSPITAASAPSATRPAWQPSASAL